MGEPLSMGEPVSISEPVWHPAPARVALVVVSLWLGVFLVAPVLTMVGGFVAPSDISRVLALPSTWRLVWFSLWQSAISVAVTLLVAAPVTWLIGLHRFRGRRILRATTTVGFLLPSVVVATAFLAVLPRSLHYTMFAVVIAHAYFNIAVVVRVVGARLELLDIQLINAARTLGAPPITVWRTIVWPLIRGAVAAAAAVIFLYCFTSFAVVRVLGGPRRSTLESDIALRAFGIGDIPAATVLALVQLVIVVSVIGVVRQFSGREQGLSRLAALPPTAVAHRQRVFACCVAIATATFVLLPIAALLWRSVQVGDTLSLAAWRTMYDSSLAASIWASARTALLAGVLGVALAVLTTLAVVRLGAIGRLIDMFSIVALAVSPVTLGLGLMLTFDIGWFDWRAKWWFVALAHTLVAFPLAVRVLVPAWRTTPIGLHQAAAVLGAGELRRLVDIDLRRMRPAIVASLGLIIAVSLGEFGAASLMSRAGGETMPVVIARLLSRTGDLVRAQAFVLASLLVVVCIAALVLVESALGRSDRVARR